MITNTLAVVAILLSGFTLWWSRKTEREQRRRDLILESATRMIANSKKLTHEHRKGFEALMDSAEGGPLRRDDMRHRSDDFRNEVGIERVILQAFGNASVHDAAESLYQAHRRVRHAIWHEDDEADRLRAWADVTSWGIGRPSEQIYPKFAMLLETLTAAVRRDARISSS